MWSRNMAEPVWLEQRDPGERSSGGFPGRKEKIKKENTPTDLDGRMGPETTSLWALDRTGERLRKRVN